MYLMVDVVSLIQVTKIYGIDNNKVANHVGAFSAAEFQPGPMYGPFDSPTDFHPFALATDWEDLRQSEQCQSAALVQALMIRLAD
jgi:hypothetical protein